ncbi:hypothetical protein OKA04_15545 [Luteolibacter flavescens]|uniref:Uncharacterized protein n=1 Tax=Luteolibacter flavescens TaxID=1859460 RepID=A0ABT3FRD5_9BACT|nr:hypothetical protein [Luteolibacter flavescens]MCW1886151.1 hypothetical protein [Luteolibacter flavescens]
MPEDPPSLNPYIPPVAVDASTPAADGRLWMVNGDHLLIRDGARLPAIPLTGREGDETTSSHQIFVAANGPAILLSLIPLAVAAAVAGFLYVETRRFPFLEFLLALFLTKLLISPFARGTRSVANLQCHLSVPATKARLRRDRLRGWLTGGSMLLFGLIIVFLGEVESLITQAEIAMEDLPVHISSLSVLATAGTIAILSFFVSAIWATMERGLKCVRHVDGWFYLSGVPATSLVRLSAMTVSAPPVRPRKVYTIYQYKLPMALLMGSRRNPWLRFILAILKAKSSPALVRQLFANAEACKNVAPGPELAARVARLREHPELGTWLNQGCNHLHSPHGELMIRVALLGSPDHRHFCHVTQARVSKMRIFVEIHEVDFRTWTTDGRCLVTSTAHPMPEMPEHVEYRHVKGGDSSEVWEIHRQRCAGISAMTVESGEAFGELMRKDAAAHAARLEAAGIQTPVEEIEMPGDWEEIEGKQEDKFTDPFARLQA